MKRTICIILCLVLAAFSCGCKSEQQAVFLAQDAPDAAAAPLQDGAAQAQLDLRADVQLQIEALTIRLLQNCMSADTSGSTLLDPCGIAMSIAALYLGSGGETAEQLRSAAGFTAEAQDVLDALDALTAAGSRPSFLLSDRYAPSGAYASALSQAGISLTAVPFGTEEALRLLNERAALIDGSLPSFSSTVPVDVLYVLTGCAPNGSFAAAFPSSERYEGLFESPDGLLPCDFLYTEAELPYYEDERVQIASLHMERGGKELLLILPTAATLTDTLENIGQYAPQWLSGEDLKPSTVRLSLPALSLHCAIPLRDALLSMGLSLPFDQTAADFSQMLETQLPLSVSEIYSLCSLSVTETGLNDAKKAPTIAAFAQSETGTDLILDRPFLLALRSRESGLIELLAWINTPN